MAEIAGSLYIVSTAVFAVMAIVIGVRLELLSRRTGRSAERMLGLGVMCTAGLGYGVMMLGVVGRALSGGQDAPAIFWWIALTGWIFHNLGVTFMLRFICLVFRTDDLWARSLAVCMTLVLWVSWVVYVADGSLDTGIAGTSYWAMLTVIGTYPIWSGVESLRYFLLMKRRAALGLADPLIVNRFLLWGLASASTVASIWVINIPSLMGLPTGLEDGLSVTTTCMFVTGLLGLATVGLYWLTFFPPRWYRERIAPGLHPES